MTGCAGGTIECRQELWNTNGCPGWAGAVGKCHRVHVDVDAHGGKKATGACETYLLTLQVKVTIMIT